MLYIGLMSGTSMDAIDAALVDFSGGKTTLIAYLQQSIETGVYRSLAGLDKNSSIDEVSKLDVRMGRLFAEAALQLMHNQRIPREKIRAIGCHGQTILHRPELPDPSSLQIGDPNIITCLTGITTVSDFRRMDMAAGGQGAPLAPVFHQYAFQHQIEDRVILNIGGIANITLLPAADKNQPVMGFDTGPGNILMDAWIAQHQGLRMDHDGHWAAGGRVNPDLLDHLIADEYFKLRPPKSTGRDYFNLDWLHRQLDRFSGEISPEDVQATLLELTSSSIATSIKAHSPSCAEVIVCGGGAHHPLLLRSLQKHLAPASVETTRHHGLDPDAVEAITFAWLAKCRLDGIKTHLPAVTGTRSNQILGAVYMAGNSI